MLINDIHTKNCMWKTTFAVKVPPLLLQELVGYCSFCKAVDGTHLVRNLISDVAHQDHNSIMSDWHYIARRFDFYLLFWTILQLFLHPWSRQDLMLSIYIE